MEEDNMQQEEEKSSFSSNDYNPCPICLGPVTHEAYLDRCFHKYCYNCIARWAKFFAAQNSQPTSILKCPFCKSDNFSIVYECEGDSFQRHYINQDPETSTFYSRAHKFRLRCYYREPGAISDKFNVLQYWKVRRYLQPNKWLQIWLKREIQALTQEEDVDIVVHHIVGVIESFMRQNEQGISKRTIEQNREYFKASLCDAARPFLMGRTEHFVNEVELFLASGLTIEAYDDVYSECLETPASSAISEDEEMMPHKLNTELPYLHFFDEDSDAE
ncbi:hypothetical protein IFM89_017520 [Coptis chinensis]|uniref:RING-type domain-containing protein n=1 Tax=Coptis chinensis TaxID=261450 RepID=A0A835LZT5_9MAGN|nr:hypothetical protein IFM89_017520 [Coptis chinensis]